ncbi:MAG: uracil-DNA glycosylase [Candidatus Woesearchaeota archaeon]|nr:MAG: uracil-DNA glycosylase [Candidatus Woesearchaeota archaeon]
MEAQTTLFAKTPGTNDKELAALQKKIETELICPLKNEATNMVFGKGNPRARIMFIGEAPGEKEDLQGIPFVGAAGRELDKLLRTINLTLEDVYIANILKYRPPKNRDPTPEEMERHTPYLIEQIKIIKPTILATLGNYSTKFVLNNFKVEGMKKIRGISELHGTPTTIQLDTLSFAVIPLYHPAAMLYKPPLRKVLEEDFLAMQEFLSKNK